MNLHIYEHNAHWSEGPIAEIHDVSFIPRKGDYLDLETGQRRVTRVLVNYLDGAVTVNVK